MVESSKMEVDIEETTHESVAEQPKIKVDAPTVLIAMGMAGSGKTTFVHVSFQEGSSIEAPDKLPQRKWKDDLQRESRSSCPRSELPMQYRHS